MKHITLITKIILIFFLVSSKIYAQGEFRGTAFTPKVGTYKSNHSEFGFFYAFEFAVLNKSNSYSIEYNKFAEWALLNSSPLSSINEVNLMYGQFKNPKKSRLYYQIGLSALWGQKSINVYNYLSPTEIENIHLLGVAFKVGYRYICSSEFAIGVEIHLNLNSKTPLISPIRITFSIGDLIENNK